MNKTILYGRWKPFKTEKGNEGAMYLKWTVYDPELVNLLKIFFADYRPHDNQPIGGWLQKYKKWYFKESYLEPLETRLNAHGYQLKRYIDIEHPNWWIPEE